MKIEDTVRETVNTSTRDIPRKSKVIINQGVQIGQYMCSITNLHEYGNKELEHIKQDKENITNIPNKNKGQLKVHDATVSTMNLLN